MQKILTAAEMREVDRVTIEERGIPGLVLMENAGARVYGFLTHHFSPLGGQRVVIICGRGNNGGDGLVIARHMVTHGQGGALQVVLLGDPRRLRGDAAANYRMLRAADFKPTIVRNPADWQRVRPSLLPATLVVDAMLGTGLRGPAEGLYREVIEDLNANFSPLGSSRLTCRRVCPLIVVNRLASPCMPITPLPSQLQRSARSSHPTASGWGSCTSHPLGRSPL